MPASLEGQLVVAISSRALFDFEEENKIFEQGDDRAYMKLQLDRLEEPARPGVAFSLVRKLLAFNDAQAQRVEVVILSRNDPVSGMRVFRSAQHYGLPIQRGSFTRGQSPWRYLKPLNANLFLSTHLSDVRAALDAPPASAAAVGGWLVGTMLVLAILEHWLLVLPLSALKTKFKGGIFSGVGSLTEVSLRARLAKVATVETPAGTIQLSGMKRNESLATTGWRSGLGDVAVSGRSSCA